MSIRVKGLDSETQVDELVRRIMDGLVDMDELPNVLRATVATKIEKAKQEAEAIASEARKKAEAAKRKLSKPKRKGKAKDGKSKDASGSV